MRSVGGGAFIHSNEGPFRVWEQRYRACAVDPEGPRVRSSVSGDSKVEAAFKDILMFKYDE